MRILSLFLACVLMFANVSAQTKTKPMYFGDASLTDFGQITHMSDIFAVSFVNGNVMDLTITDTTLHKTLHINLDTMIYQRYVDASELGMQDSMFVVVFGGRVDNLTQDKINVSFVYYKNSPLLHSICFGRRERYMIIKSKYETNRTQL